MRQFADGQHAHRPEEENDPDDDEDDWPGERTPARRQRRWHWYLGVLRSSHGARHFSPHPKENPRPALQLPPRPGPFLETQLVLREAVERWVDSPTIPEATDRHVPYRRRCFVQVSPRRSLARLQAKSCRNRYR